MRHEKWGNGMSTDGTVCRTQYQLVLDRRQANFDSHFATTTLAAKHQLAHQRLLDVEAVYASVVGRRESRIFDLASQLLADGLSQLACANYRLAFFCLRAFLEMSLAAIRFSAHEFELREWEAGIRDVSWTTLSNDDTGCFSTSFVGAFFPQLKGEAKHYQSLAKRAYREASEYVHTNMDVDLMITGLPKVAIILDATPEQLKPGRFLAMMVDRVLKTTPVTMHKDARKRRVDAPQL
ncbi:hypothetical protein P3W23_12960 [Luteibacter sp. PPL554]